MATLRTEPDARARTRERRRRSRSRPWLPFVWVFGAVALAITAWQLVGWWQRTHVTLSFVRAGTAVPPLELTFYPDELAFASPSPPDAFGELQLAGGASCEVELGEDLVPGYARVRYRGDGVGAGVAYARLGQPLPPITLRAPATLRGRVGEPLGFWSFGWRCAGYLPIAGAEVVVMGGGEHGVELARARTDADGRFEVTGFDGELDALGLRVRAAGYGLAHQAIRGLETHDGERALVALSKVPQRRGRLDLQVDLDPTGLLVLARGLPGVQATPKADGAFVLDHVPADVEARLVVHGLPSDVAQGDVRTDATREVVVPLLPGATVSGRVLGLELEPLEGAWVWIDDQPAVRTDAAGRYLLTGMRPGRVTIAAQWQQGRGRAARKLHQQRSLDLSPRARLVDIDLPLDLSR